MITLGAYCTNESDEYMMLSYDTPPPCEGTLLVLAFVCSVDLGGEMVGKADKLPTCE